MDGSELRQVAMRVGAGLPAAALSRPFGEEWEVFKVADKIFAMVAERHGVTMVTVKAVPAHAAALVLAHDEVTPGYHMNKRHWISVGPGSGVDETMIEDLVANSYDVVVATLPRHRRPLDLDRRTVTEP